MINSPHRSHFATGQFGPDWRDARYSSNFSSQPFASEAIALIYRLQSIWKSSGPSPARFSLPLASGFHGRFSAAPVRSYWESRSKIHHFIRIDGSLRALCHDSTGTVRIVSGRINVLPESIPYERFKLENRLQRPPRLQRIPQE